MKDMKPNRLGQTDAGLLLSLLLCFLARVAHKGGQVFQPDSDGQGGLS